MTAKSWSRPSMVASGVKIALGLALLLLILSPLIAIA